MNNISTNEVILGNVKELAGGGTRCFYGKILINNKRINVVYDVYNDNLVIHEWYKLQPDEIPVLTDLVKTFFRNLVDLKEKFKNKRWVLSI